MGAAVIYSAADIELGSNVNVVIRPHSGSSTFGNDRFFTLEFRLFDERIEALYNVEATSGASSLSFTNYVVPLLSKIYKYFDYSTGSMTIILYTYSDSGRTNLVGTSLDSFDISLPSAYVPSLTTSPITIINSGQYAYVDFAVIGISNINVRAQGTSKFSSTGTNIKKYNVWGFGGYRSIYDNTLNYTFLCDDYGAQDTATFSVSCQDEREYTSNKVDIGTITRYRYRAPDITKCIISRNEGTNNISILCDWTLYKKNNTQQTLSYARVYYKLKTAGSFSSYITIPAAYKNTVYNVTSPTFDVTLSYDFKFVVADSSSGIAEQYTSIGTGGDTISLLPSSDGKQETCGVAFGKEAEYHGVFECNYDAWFNKSVSINSDPVATKGYAQKKRVEIWHSASVQQFGSGRITVQNTSGFDEIEVVAVQSTNEGTIRTVSSFCIPGKHGMLVAFGGSATLGPVEHNRRRYEVGETYVEFLEAEVYTESTGQVTKNTNILVPYAMYGIGGS